MQEHEKSYNQIFFGKFLRQMNGWGQLNHNL